MWSLAGFDYGYIGSGSWKALVVDDAVEGRSRLRTNGSRSWWRFMVLLDHRGGSTEERIGVVDDAVMRRFSSGWRREWYAWYFMICFNQPGRGVVGWNNIVDGAAEYWFSLGNRSGQIMSYSRFFLRHGSRISEDQIM